MLIPFHELTRFFVNGSPRGVIHIGAHKAEELEGYHSIGVQTITWIEANPELISGLLFRTMHSLGSTVHCFAAHEKDNEAVTFNIANNRECSSILELGECKVEHPQIHYTQTISVKSLTIDTFLKYSGFNQSSFDFVNIDIQGAEMLALRGMKDQLDYIKYVYVEVNEKPIYVGCPLIDEIDEFLGANRFSRVSTKMTTHGWGDALYVKNKESV